MPRGMFPLLIPWKFPPRRGDYPQRHIKKKSGQLMGKNLRTIIETASSRNVPVLFAVPVPNLLMAPFFSAHSEGFEQRAGFASLLEDIQTAFVNRRLSLTLELLEQAEKQSPNYAQIHYWRGVVYARRLQVDEAFAAYQRALDLDVRTHRITSGLQAQMIETATQMGAPVVDLPSVFRQQFRKRKPKELFLDHCHPTRLGHQIIADELFPEVMRAIGIPQ